MDRGKMGLFDQIKHVQLVQGLPLVTSTRSNPFLWLHGPDPRGLIDQANSRWGLLLERGQILANLDIAADQIVVMAVGVGVADAVWLQILGHITKRSVDLCL
jgi:hypothetical protein